MNKFIIIFLTYFVFSFSLNAQCDIRMFDIYTPAGSAVVTFLMCESSTSTRSYYDSYYSTSYPNAIKITTNNTYSSTRTVMDMLGCGQSNQ